MGICVNRILQLNITLVAKLEKLDINIETY